jgi:Kef-type K+ transport system membrane component KefB
VKVLYDKFELDTLPGRITLGVLVLQDLFAILFLAIQPSLGDLQIDIVLLSIVRVCVLLTAALLISRFTLPHLFQIIARLPELVLVGALAWCFAVAEFAEFLGLSREMGALVAGVSLSTFPYALDVTAKVTSLRDFFITLFFVALGMTVPLPTASVLGLALVIVVFTLACFHRSTPCVRASAQASCRRSTWRRSANSRWCSFRWACRPIRSSRPRRALRPRPSSCWRC